MSNFDLFSNDEELNKPLKISDRGLDVEFFSEFFSYDESLFYYHDLLENTNWNQERIKYYGKIFDLPRLTAWYGDNGKEYKYSGILVVPNLWTNTLLQIKGKVELETGYQFNSVLLNLYRDGQDSIAAHSDDEPELGVNPIIASVSFGAERNFVFQNKTDKNAKHKILLTNGSLVIMKGETQEKWVHSISKTSAKLKPRINLTFRNIVSK